MGSTPEFVGPGQNAAADLACHALRQPLQSLVLIQALLARTVEGDVATKLVARMDAALGVMMSIVDDITGPGRNAAASEWLQASSSGGTSSPFVPRAMAEVANSAAATVFVVDDDAGVRGVIADVLEAEGLLVQQFDSCEAFLAQDHKDSAGCLLVDAYLPGMHGLDLLRWIQSAGLAIPAIMITGNSDVPMAVQAMKAGAVDFIEKPVGRAALLTCVARAVEQSRDQQKLVVWRLDAAMLISKLTQRQREILDMVLAGHPSKNIAANLGISQRTVENHRASIMKRTGAKSLPALARLAIAAAGVPDAPSPQACIGEPPNAGVG